MQELRATQRGKTGPTQPRVILAPGMNNPPLSGFTYPFEVGSQPMVVSATPGETEDPAWIANLQISSDGGTTWVDVNIHGQAAELSADNALLVVPVSGWWRLRTEAEDTEFAIYAFTMTHEPLLPLVPEVVISGPAGATGSTGPTGDTGPTGATGTGGGGGTLYLLQQDFDNVPDTSWNTGDYVVAVGDLTQNGSTAIEFVDGGPDFFTVWNGYAGAFDLVNSLSGGLTITDQDGNALTAIAGNSAWEFIRQDDSSAVPPGVNGYVGYQIAPGGGLGTSTLQKAVIDLDTTDILALDGTWPEFMATPGNDSFNLPTMFAISCHSEAGETLTTSGLFHLFWTFSMVDIVDLSGLDPSTMWAGTPDRVALFAVDNSQFAGFLTGDMIGKASMQNQGISFRCDDAITGAGTVTMKLTLFYSKVDLAV